MGIVEAIRDNLIEAEDLFKKSLDIYQDLEDKSGIARSFFSLGLVLKCESQLEKAMKHYSKAARLYSLVSAFEDEKTAIKSFFEVVEAMGKKRAQKVLETVSDEEKIYLNHLFQNKNGSKGKGSNYVF